MTQPPKKGKGKSKGKGKAVKEPGTGKSVEEVSQNRYYSVRLYLILHDVSKKLSPTFSAETSAIIIRF